MNKLSLNLGLSLINLIATGAEAGTRIHCTGGPQASIQTNIELGEPTGDHKFMSAFVDGNHGTYTVKAAPPNTRLTGYSFVDIYSSDRYMDRAGRTRFKNLNLLVANFDELMDPIGSTSISGRIEIGTEGPLGTKIIHSAFLDCKKHVDTQDMAQFLSGKSFEETLKGPGKVLSLGKLIAPLTFEASYGGPLDGHPGGDFTAKLATAHELLLIFTSDIDGSSKVVEKFHVKSFGEQEVFLSRESDKAYFAQTLKPDSH